MNSRDLIELYEYNLWATGRTAPAVLGLSTEELHRRIVSSYPSVQQTISHMVGAGELWLQRWKRGEWRPLEESHAFPQEAAPLVARWRACDEGLLDFVRNATDVEEWYEFKNTLGHTYRHRLREMALHVTHHQSYHRGQLTTLLRQLGKQPFSQDMIAFIRERESPDR